MAMYKSTPAYQAYVQAKSRGNPVIEDPEPKGIRTAERRIDIQPAEDEEDPDDGLSVKHVAHARYCIFRVSNKPAQTQDRPALSF